MMDSKMMEKKELRHHFSIHGFAKNRLAIYDKGHILIYYIRHRRTLRGKEHGQET